MLDGDQAGRQAFDAVHMGIRDVVDELGGFATRPELLAAGATDRMLTAAVRADLLRRVRNGWYSTADPRDARFRAVRVGGRLTGISAFEAWHAWVWRRRRQLQVAVPDNAARLRRVQGVRIHWSPPATGGSKTIVSASDALVRVLLDEPLEVAVACADWTLASGTLERIDVERSILDLPAAARPIARLIDGESQSVLESVARVRLLRAGFSLLSQQRTGEVGATDLVVEGAVALELDGREFHAKYFERDRRRDLVTTNEGLHVIRVSHSMLRDEWPSVVGAIRAALAARGVENSGHLRPISPASQRIPRRRAEVS